MTVTAGPLSRADPLLDTFAALVGSDGPVCVVGGRTQWDVGGACLAGTREVVAPSGVVSHQPAEMIVRVRAGTTVADLNQVLAEAGQMVPLDPGSSQATVGGVLAVGHSGLRRLRYGPVRDTVLEVRFVSAGGELVTAGGPVVKNVTGYDLCRLLVGSLGTLGLIAEVVLRCYPVAAASRWLRSEAPGSADPFAVLRSLYRPSSVLWDGSDVWVLLEGHPADVSAQADRLGAAFVEVEAPPVPSTGGRVSVPPGDLRRLAPAGASVGLAAGGNVSVPPGDLRRLGSPGASVGLAAGGSVGVSPGVGARWLAQVGVGVVQTSEPAAVAAAVGRVWPPVLTPRVAELHRALKRRFDPTGRLNPGRSV